MNPSDRIGQLATGHWVSQMVHAFAKLGMGDAFAGQPQSAERIATTCGTRPEATYRLLRALAMLEVVHQSESDPHVFSLTPVGELLVTTHPQSMVPNVLLEAGYEHVLEWTHFTANMLTGELAPRAIFGVEQVFDLFETRPGFRETFIAAMGSYTAIEIGMIRSLTTFDLSRIEHLVDVGGAHGALLQALLGQYPHLTGTLFDRADVVAGVQPSARMAVEAGDFFQTATPGADGYILKHILHDWDDPECVTILTTIARVMREGARLFIAEFGPVPGPNAPHFAKLMDLHMMLLLAGHERTLPEWEALLGKAGLRILKLHQSEAPLSIIEAGR